MTRAYIRCAGWLLQRFLSCDDALLGDLIEQSRERSALWLWRQVIAIGFIRLSQLLLTERGAMKRITTITMILMGVFLIGFWVGRNPALMTLEPPPRLDEMPRPNRTPRSNVFGTTEFLLQELERARNENERERTPETQHRVENLEEKVAAAMRASQMERR